MNTGAKTLKTIDEEEEKTAATVEEEKHEPSEADLEAQRMRANWTKQFLEHHGWNYIFDSFMAKQISSAATVTFAEQANLKDLSFRLTLLRVFLQAGFQSQQDSIGKAVRFVRQSSSLNESSSGNKASQDQAIELMKSPQGTEIMLSTDFGALLDKILALLAATLSKPSLVFEDRDIVENALSILVGTVLYKRELYEKFVGFKGQGEISNAEQLSLTGLLNAQDKVRIDFASALKALAYNLGQE